MAPEELLNSYVYDCTCNAPSDLQLVHYYKQRTQVTRLIQTIDDGKVYYPLLLIAAITVPVQGLPNFLVYLMPRYTKVKKEMPKAGLIKWLQSSLAREPPEVVAAGHDTELGDTATRQEKCRDVIAGTQQEEKGNNENEITIAKEEAEMQDVQDACRHGNDVNRQTEMKNISGDDGV